MAVLANPHGGLGTNRSFCRGVRTTVEDASSVDCCLCPDGLCVFETRGTVPSVASGFRYVQGFVRTPGKTESS